MLLQDFTLKYISCISQSASQCNCGFAGFYTDLVFISSRLCCLHFLVCCNCADCLAMLMVISGSHQVADFGRHLWRLSRPRQGHLEPVAQGYVQLIFIMSKDGDSANSLFNLVVFLHLNAISCISICAHFLLSFLWAPPSLASFSFHLSIRYLYALRSPQAFSSPG